MSLLSALAAHELGYLSTDALVTRLDQTLTTLEGLERHQGHFLNWYDTETRAPLHPRYVSTVDSGNLAGALITLSHGLQALIAEPQARHQRRDGLADTADLLAAASSTGADTADQRERFTTINGIARAIAAEARGEPE